MIPADPAPATSNLPELTVSELAGQIKRAIETGFDRVRVRGELGRVTLARSGHLYVDIKDADAVLNTVMWKANAARLPFRPEEGLEVVAEGRLSTYPGRSAYQLIADTMRPAGAGALMALLEERRQRLSAEGLFDPARKRPLPYLPRVIGVVTSPTGAVIRDILHRIRERFPVRVIVWPALVQGELAAAQITAGIQGLNALTGPDRPDLIIVARGGGSIEDLWPFNEESVVRAAAASAIPLISGVGHETDTTLIDHAADVRAPTPTGAAEMAVPVRTELMLDVSAKANRLIRALARTSQLAASHLKAVAVRLPAPERLFETRAQRVDRAGSRLASALGRRAARARATFLTLSGRLPRPQGLIQPRRDALIREARDLTRALQTRVQRARNALTLPASRLRPDTVARETLRQREAVTRLDARASRAIQRRLEGASARLSASARLIETLSYTSVLARGFVLVRDASGQVLRGVADARSASTLHLSFADGTLRAMPLPDTGSPPPEPAPETSPARRPRPRKPPGSSATPQSSLFDTGEA